MTLTPTRLLLLLLLSLASPATPRPRVVLRHPFWQQVTDLTGAYRLYRRAVLDRLLGSVTSKGYAFQMEMIARATALGASIAEVPIVFVDRVFGQSKLGRNEYTMFVSGLVRLFFTL